MPSEWLRKYLRGVLGLDAVEQDMQEQLASRDEIIAHLSDEMRHVYTELAYLRSEIDRKNPDVLASFSRRDLELAVNGHPDVQSRLAALERRR